MPSAFGLRLNRSGFEALALCAARSARAVPDEPEQVQPVRDRIGAAPQVRAVLHRRFAVLFPKQRAMTFAGGSVASNTPDHLKMMPNEIAVGSQSPAGNRRTPQSRGLADEPIRCPDR